MLFIRFGPDGRDKEDMAHPHSATTLHAPTRAALLETICDMHGLDYDLNEDEILDRSGLADQGIEIAQMADGVYAAVFPGLCAIASVDTIEEAHEKVQNYRISGLYAYWPVAYVYAGRCVGYDPEQDWPLFVPERLVAKL